MIAGIESTIERPSEYKKDLQTVREELLKRNDYISFKDLVKRFDKIDEEYNHSNWNLLQIYSNFNILIGENIEREKE